MNFTNQNTDLTNFFEVDEPDFWNISHANKILLKRKFARFVASLICQTHDIENKLKTFAEKKHISLKDKEIIKESSELYDQMLILITEWKNLHFRNEEIQRSRNHSNLWTPKIFNETSNTRANYIKYNNIQ